MATGRIRLWLLGACLLIAEAGCSQSGGFTSRQTTTNNLKASVSQLQFENDNLKKQMGELRADASRTETELAQERDANGELSARLDDAKDLIRRKGGDATALNSSSHDPDPDAVPPPYTRPPARRAKGGRKPPAAQIPRVEFDPSGFEDKSLEPSSHTRDPGPQAWLDDDRWLPVARGLGNPVVVK